MNEGRRARTQSVAPLRPSRTLLRFFDRYLYFFFRRHFHGLRLAGAEQWARAPRPLVVCLNHPSWWDPLTSILLSRFIAKTADHYAPMDERAFARYGILRRLGLFPVEQGTPRGGAQFLRAASHILDDRNAVLWVTPQGGFTDVRTRPVEFRPGLDALLRRMPHVALLPLAIEYTFWDERLPEALAMFGEPLLLQRERNGRGERSPGDVAAEALAATQDALAGLARRRDPSLFTPVLAGSAGTSGVYGAWQRLRARLHGKTFEPEHTVHGRSERS